MTGGPPLSLFFSNYRTADRMPTHENVPSNLQYQLS